MFLGIVKQIPQNFDKNKLHQQHLSALIFIFAFSIETVLHQPK